MPADLHLASPGVGRPDFDAAREDRSGTAGL
jgi:hypothetical protein